MFARSLAGFHGTVDLRYAHEMNGTWYPWSHDPIGYRRAWRHVVRVFRAAGAANVRFVWSPNPSLYLPPAPGGAACASIGRAAATSARSARR